MKIKPLTAALAALGMGVCFGVQAAPDELREKAKVIIQPIQPAKIEHPAKVDLGRQLFFEPRLSMWAASTT
jgi:cytochrome c peroxidase